RGGTGHGVGRGGRGGEQVTHGGRGLPVQARVPGQACRGRAPGQRISDDEKREEAQQQRGGEKNAPVDEVRRVQLVPQVFRRRPGILLLAPLGCPPDRLSGGTAILGRRR